MKILHIDPDDIDNPLSGGGPMRTYEIYKRIAHKHEITVLTPTFPGSTPELIRDGIRYIRLGKKIGNHGSSHHITFFFSLPKAVRRFTYDLLVEDFMPPMSVTLSPIFKPRNKPLVASVQWFGASLLSKQYKLPFFLGERFGIKMYKNFIVLTPAMAAQIQKHHKRASCQVIPNAVDENLFELRPQYGDFILYLGMVEFGTKGTDLLLEAYAKIPDSLKLPLVLAGHSFQFDILKTKLHELKLTNWVKVLGKVDTDTRDRLLSECRFMCVPSRKETFGMVSLEACASAKPIVTFDHWPMNEVTAKDACLLATPFCTDSLAEKMTEMLEMTSDNLENRGQLCRKHAQNYRWDIVAQRQEAFYQQIVNQH